MKNKSAFNGNALSDLSFWGILIGNTVSIVLACAQGWDLTEAMWVYWFQSVIIGIVNAYRMLSLKEFSTEGLIANGRHVPETRKAQISATTFFVFHYGLFHLVYFVFLWDAQPLTTLPVEGLVFLVIAVMSFGGAHSFSFIYNRQEDFKHKKPNLGALMSHPYMRIVPMHMTFIFAQGAGAIGLIIFMVLKTVADCGMHAVEHYLYRKS